MAIITATATIRAIAATAKPKSRRVPGFCAKATMQRTQTAGKAATAAAIGADVPATVQSGCISETWANHSTRTIGSIMAKGPPRHCGSSVNNTAAAATPDASTPAARAGQAPPASIAADTASPRVATIAAAAELIAIASQDVLPQWAGPTLTANATATLAAAP